MQSEQPPQITEAPCNNLQRTGQRRSSREATNRCGNTIREEFFTMDFGFSPKVIDLAKRVAAFRDEHIYPNERRFSDETAFGADRWRPAPILEELRRLARQDGLWNL